MATTSATPALTQPSASMPPPPTPTDPILVWLTQALDPPSTLPLHRRLYEALRSALLQHRLVAGDRLPSTRDLARHLKLSRNTVLSAVNQLQAEGYVQARTGSGTQVSDHLPRPLAVAGPSGAMGSVGSMATAGAAYRSKRARMGDAAPEASALSVRGRQLSAHAGAQLHEVQPFAGPEEDYGFPFRVWQRLQARHWRQADPALLDYDPRGGHPALKAAVAEYLRVSRAVDLDPADVLITGGTQQALDVSARLLADSGDTVWMEDPGYWAAERVMRAAGLSLHPVAVDGEGLAPAAADLLRPPRLIYVTPSHQYPCGVVMSLPRRRQLLEVAHQHDAWILEDDYDAEFRYEGRPIASLQGLAPERVLYFGTFSKVLYPGMRLGYAVVPGAIRNAFGTALYDLHRPGQLMVQAALADFMREGHFATHIRRQRQVYSARRAMLIDALQSVLGQTLSLSPAQTGLHLVVYLPDAADDTALARRCAAEGLRVRPLSAYALRRDAGAAAPTQGHRKGLVVGYAYVPDHQVRPRGRLLAQLIAPVLSAATQL